MGTEERSLPKSLKEASPEAELDRFADAAEELIAPDFETGASVSVSEAKFGSVKRADMADDVNADADEEEELKRRKKINYSVFMPRVRLLWLALPDEARKAFLDAGNAVLEEIMDTIERRKLQFHPDPVVSAYVQSLLFGRIRSVQKEFASDNYSRTGHQFSAPPMRLHTLGYWLDELKCPEEFVWLCMTVPRRVWYQLVTNPVKRHKFLEFIRSLFSDRTPLDRS